MPTPCVENGLTIRTARPDEAGILCELILAMAWESEERQLDRAVLSAGVQAVFDNPALGTYWVVVRDDRPVACTMITSEWSDWNNAPYWWIQSLYIQPEWRGKGLFERLLSELEAAARAQGVAEIRLYVEQNNQRAIRAYQKAGFDADHYHCMIKPLV